MSAAQAGRRAALGSLIALLTGACATEWQVAREILPLSGVVPPTREGGSVGVLARIAVMQVEVIAQLSPEQQEDPKWQRRLAEMGAVLQHQVTDYLTREKGYEARAVDARLPRDEAQIRALARDLGVDGLVRVERYYVPAWTATDIGMNLLLLNVPLARRLREINLRVSVHEGRSGQVVWIRELLEQSTDTEVRVDFAKALSDLDNAVPRQLRR